MANRCVEACATACTPVLFYWYVLCVHVIVSACVCIPMYSTFQPITPLTFAQFDSLSSHKELQAFLAWKLLPPLTPCHSYAMHASNAPVGVTAGRWGVPRMLTMVWGFLSGDHFWRICPGYVGLHAKGRPPRFWLRAARWQHQLQWRGVSIDENDAFQSSAYWLVSGFCWLVSGFCWVFHVTFDLWLNVNAWAGPKG